MSRARIPKGPYEKTNLPGGVNRIIEVIEYLRSRNQDGYLPGVGGILAGLKRPPGLPIPPKCHGTTCSPFTATVIGVAFDPRFPIANDKDLTDDPYVPKFNGGKDELVPFQQFYSEHNRGGGAVDTVVRYGLGRELKKDEFHKVRRGDLIEISWHPSHGGHVVFCWDVHTDAEGKADCIQIIGSNGPTGGVTIHGCKGKQFLKGANASYKQEKKEVEVPDPRHPGKKKKKKRVKTVLVKKGNYEKVHDPMFVDSDEIVKLGHWYGLPGVKKGSVNLKTFRVHPAHPILYSRTANYSFDTIRIARMNYEGDAPASYATLGADGAAPAPGSPAKPAPAPKPAEKEKPGHLDAPVVVVKAPEVKKDPEAPKKVAPKPAEQEKKKPLRWQRYVESSLQIFYQAKWIDADPGEPDDIADAKSKAALKKFQEKFKLQVDGIIGPESLGAIQKQLPFCLMQGISQTLLLQLHAGGKLGSDPGPIDGINNDETRAAIEDFQKQNGLGPTGVPDADTFAKILDILKAHEPTASKPGLAPQMRHLYWVGNEVEPGGSAKLRLHFKDLIVGQECPIFLTARGADDEVEARVRLKVERDEAEIAVPIPAAFGIGSEIDARVTASLAGEGELEVTTDAPLVVRPTGKARTEAADWRPYIGKPELPDAIVETVERNRALFTARKIDLVKKGKYAGPEHYNYRPPKSHRKWAKEHFQKKVDAAPEGERQIPSAFLLMLDAEGLPASLQTYDNQIVTWGVGLGAKGDGVHAFRHMNEHPEIKKLLDDIGINYENYNYHVVDVTQKKVVSSSAGSRGNGNRHLPPLKAWRAQKDLLNAVIAISEDPETREAVGESQYSVYVSNSTKWPGKDKVFTGALFFMIAHLHHWLPAIAKRGIHVDEFFAKIGGSPSLETDRKLAPMVANGFIHAAKAFFVTSRKPAHQRKASYDDVRDRVPRRIWARLKSDGRAEGFDPGNLKLDPA